LQITYYSLQSNHVIRLFAFRCVYMGNRPNSLRRQRRRRQRWRRRRRNNDNDRRHKYDWRTDRGRRSTYYAFLATARSADDGWLPGEQPRVCPIGARASRRRTDTLPTEHKREYTTAMEFGGDLEKLVRVARPTRALPRTTV